VTDPATRLADLRSGAADMIMDVPSDQVPALKSGGFNIVEKDGVYVGTIVKMFQKPGDPPPESFRCSKCEGADKDQPVLGLTLIKGMKRKGVKYEDGTIMDPRDGNVYRALMEVSPDNKRLEVRGYLGVALFGRSQTWNRLPDNALGPQPATARPASKGGAQKKQ